DLCVVVECLEVLAFPAGAADVEEERAAHAAEDANRRGHGVDEREAELGVQEERVLPDEGQVLVAAQLAVAAEEEEVRVVAPAREAARAQGQESRPADPEVLAGIGVERLP